MAAHALENLISPEQIDSFNTGVRYQMYHSLLLLFLAISKNDRKKLILRLIIIGVFCFSFSIYLLSLKDWLEWDFLKFLGPVTPIGGSLLIIAWALLFYHRFINKTASN